RRPRLAHQRRARGPRRPARTPPAGHDHAVPLVEVERHRARRLRVDLADLLAELTQGSAEISRGAVGIEFEVADRHGSSLRRKPLGHQTRGPAAMTSAVILN
ncbi:MAG: hypothetical protein ACK56F_31230, partial [bacterium]